LSKNMSGRHAPTYDFDCQRSSVGREGSRRRRGPARGTGNFGSREQPVARPTIRDAHLCPVLTDVSDGLSVVRAHSSRGPHLRTTYTFCARKRHGWRVVTSVTPGRAGRNKSEFSDVVFRTCAHNCSRKTVNCARALWVAWSTRLVLRSEATSQGSKGDHVLTERLSRWLSLTELKCAGPWR